MVAAYDDSGSYLDGRDSRTPLLYGIVEADVSDDTTLTMSLRRQEQVINGYSIYGLPRYSNGQSLNLSRSTNLAQKWNRLESDMTEVFTEVAHRFNEDWISKTSLTYSQGGFDQNIAYARGAINPTTLAGSNFQGTLFRKDKVDSVGLNSQLEGNFNAFGLEAGCQHASGYRDEKDRGQRLRRQPERVRQASPSGLDHRHRHHRRTRRPVRQHAYSPERTVERGARQPPELV
jgi:outer membrane receptor for ferric coprogen and ferric-rhodotorulic acid